MIHQLCILEVDFGIEHLSVPLRMAPNGYGKRIYFPPVQALGYYFNSLSYTVCAKKVEGRIARQYLHLGSLSLDT